MGAGAGVAFGGGVRPTKILYDLAAADGTTLLEALWMTERDMQGTFMPETKRVLACPEGAVRFRDGNQ